MPTDIVLAARFLRDNKDPNLIDAQNWDPNVKGAGVRDIPEIITMMNEIGLDESTLVPPVMRSKRMMMQAIQMQRAKRGIAWQFCLQARTPQQQVIVEKSVIQIVPADPQVIYVAIQTPRLSHVQQYNPVTPSITFGLGFAMGA